MANSTWPGVVSAFRPRLKVEGEPVTLLEGNTPLIECPRLADWACPGARLFVKYEGLNPTGSFKDRGMTSAITQAVHDGAQAVICASTGNTAASAAAYAARAGLKCIVLIPQGKVAMGKLAGSVAYGAEVIQIDGSFDDGLRLVREISDRTPIALVNSVNPARLEGQKTGAFEINDALGQSPDWLCLPVGNAGNISAYWVGFSQDANERAFGKPQLLGGQAAGSAPIVLGHVVDRPETIATAIRIGNPARWFQAKEALADSEGQLWRVTDDEILEAYGLLSRKEGVFCEPSSAAGVAALRKSVVAGELTPEGRTIVAILTGHGLKDPDAPLASFKEVRAIGANYDEIMKVIG
ncbi:MAG: threonine synthase [Chthonomonas sp.]|nr:threonine synthase [Chthonomonas sp.]